MGRLEEALRKGVPKQAKVAGTDATKITTELDIQCTKTEVGKVFSEATIQVKARGRPRIA